MTRDISIDGRRIMGPTTAPIEALEGSTTSTTQRAPRSAATWSPTTQTSAAMAPPVDAYEGSRSSMAQGPAPVPQHGWALDPEFRGAEKSAHHAGHGEPYHAVDAPQHTRLASVSELLGGAGHAVGLLGLMHAASALMAGIVDPHYPHEGARRLLWQLIGASIGLQGLGVTTGLIDRAHRARRAPVAG